MALLLEKIVISYFFCSGSKLGYLGLIYTQKRPSNLVQMIPHFVLIPAIDGCNNKSGVFTQTAACQQLPKLSLTPPSTHTGSKENVLQQRICCWFSVF